MEDFKKFSLLKEGETKATDNTLPLSHSDKQGAKEFELKYCDKCIQMTNHQNGSCRKCVQRGAEEIFCKLYSSEYGEKVDSIYQIKIDTFDGLELLTLCKKYAQAERQRAITEYVEDYNDKIKSLLQWCWMDCKNRHRLYPDNNHTFSDWWEVTKDNILKELKESSKR